MAERKESRAEYLKKHRREQGRAPRFIIDVTDKDSVIRDKFEKARNFIGNNVTNGEVMTKLIDTFLNINKQTECTQSGSSQSHSDFSGYTTVNREDVDEQLFVSTVSATECLLNMVSAHILRQGCAHARIIGRVSYMVGHCAVVHYHCQDCDIDLANWPSSPYLPNHKFLVNYRMAHGYFCSGILQNQYERMMLAANAGCIQRDYYRKHFRNGASYYTATEDEYIESCRTSVLLEVGEALTEAEYSTQRYNGISIVTDARHGWRKNSRQTDVVCVGHLTHRVISNQIITKDDDPAAQRHERLGTERIYHHLANHRDGPVYVRIHAHDRNLAINKYVRESHPDVINQNDIWHTVKAVEKEIKEVSRGAKYKHGITWHEELSDKVASIRTHVSYIIRNCGGNVELIRSGMDNIVEHYKNNHTRCLPQSRCKTDSNYLPTKIIIVDPRAENLLLASLHQCTVYKTP
jgi:hypothetical protein